MAGYVAIDMIGALGGIGFATALTTAYFWLVRKVKRGY